MTMEVKKDPIEANGKLDLKEQSAEKLDRDMLETNIKSRLDDVSSLSVSYEDKETAITKDGDSLKVGEVAWNDVDLSKLVLPSYLSDEESVAVYNQFDEMLHKIGVQLEDSDSSLSDEEKAKLKDIIREYEDDINSLDRQKVKMITKFVEDDIGEIRKLQDFLKVVNRDALKEQYKDKINASQVAYLDRKYGSEKWTFTKDQPTNVDYVYLMIDGQQKEFVISALGGVEGKE